MIPDGHAFLRLLTWLSPSFPVGGFSYSHGLEFAVEAGLVRDRGDLVGWLDTVLTARRGSRRRHPACGGMARRPRRRCRWPGGGDGMGVRPCAAPRRRRSKALLRAARSWTRSAASGPIRGWTGRAEALAAGRSRHGRRRRGGPRRRPARADRSPAICTPSRPTSSRPPSASYPRPDRRPARAGGPGARDPGRGRRGDACDRWPRSARPRPMVEWASMRHETQYTRLFRS